jgi:biopolymer transport protein ExbD
MNRKAHPHETEHELNLVPYLDIMVNLVMFMLLSMTGFITFDMVNVNMPDLSEGSASSAPPPKPAAENLTLNVSVSTKGFYVAASGGVLPGENPGAPGQGAPTIPLKANGDYDYDALTKKMEEIKTKYPATSQFFLAADKTVKYDVIIHTMDATRGDSTHVLFPDVAFAAIL